MKPKKRSFLLTGVLVVLVGVALASGGLQIPKALNVLANVAGIAPAPIADADGPAVPRIAATRDGYAAGDVVTLRGSGWLPNEVVTLIDEGGKTLGTVVAGEDGSFLVEFTSKVEPGTKLLVLAKGIEGSVGTIVSFAKLPQADQTNFIDFAQCANGKEGTAGVTLGCEQWINGILNPNNSNYSENESVPQRAVWSVPTSSSIQEGRTVDFTFQARKGDIHAYDFVTKYSNTQTLLLNNPDELCKGLTDPTDCVPDLDPTVSCFTVPTDNTVVDDPAHEPGLSTAGAQALYSPNEVCMWGGTITDISPADHDHENCPGSGAGENCADDFAKFVITYDVDPDFDGKVFLVYGGHTASATYWGIGEGSSSVSGGPYHFKWTSEGAVGYDEISFGNRDNQIQGSALVDTPTPTNTPTDTPTNTPTDTPTNTPTDTPTNTPTDTPTNTPTDTPTNTPTDTPTNTPTNTPTDTPTNTPTNTPTDTPTPTPTNTPTNTPTPNVFEGCTPGFWKQQQHLDDWVPTGFSPNQTLESVFDVPDQCNLDNVTLLDALSLKGNASTCGAMKTLLRAAVAALLNSAHPDIDYPLTTAQVIAQVNAALASGDRSTMLALASQLDAYNNFGALDVCGLPPTPTPSI